MKTFTGEFSGVPNGEVHPRTFKAGEPCPPELEEAAAEKGLLSASEKKAVKPAENK